MFLSPTLGSRRTRRQANWQYLAKRVPTHQRKFHSLADDAIRKQSLSLQYRAQTGESLDGMLVEAFALVREAARRTVAMEHYPTQILGGIAMHHGSIAEMQTGEGKTLTATLPLFLAALLNRGANLATANDYLAARDAGWVSPIFKMLGMSVGIVTSDTKRNDRSRAYRASMTYSTAKEVGFDFLRDRLLKRQNELIGAGEFGDRLSRDQNHRNSDAAIRPVQRDLHFMLVDEADSILIDDARTPLVVSGVPGKMAQARAALYRWAAGMTDKLSSGKHFSFDADSGAAELTGTGRQLIRKSRHPESISELPLLDMYEFVEQAILVAHRYSNDRHYIVRDGEVVIVDEFTGRLAEGRKWRAGIHQAIEAREKLEVSVESGDAARITIQDLFLRYQRLAGMTGTVASSATELKKIYQLRSIRVPTHRPARRQNMADLVFATENEKWDAIVQEVRTFHEQGRPVLIGTRNIDQSAILSNRIAKVGIDHQVLNAVQVEQEAEIVAQAGGHGKVTVATNMAGRGTDIRLDQEAIAAGGLHVICTELHESARVDRQLIGRCGRQGDPGSFRQFMSLEDDILVTGFGEAFAKRIHRHSAQGSDQLSRLAPIFRRAQNKIERKHFRARKMLLYFDRQRQDLQREMGQDPYLDGPG